MLGFGHFYRHLNHSAAAAMTEPLFSLTPLAPMPRPIIFVLSRAAVPVISLQTFHFCDGVIERANTPLHTL